MGELVQVVFHNRSKDREYLFNAEIINKEAKRISPAIKNSYPLITEDEAINDGFLSLGMMMAWFLKTYSRKTDRFIGPLNKLTLRRV